MSYPGLNGTREPYSVSTSSKNMERCISSE
jgi:hypothetical protein